ncbi:MAG: bifunctional folylpolyglutamate synthase/dihydrofolate synthase [Candidatus Omnitrophica bacterium]|nr:bifunctional folylpolyglutamate synthase/dihydrofolate synthase [Candidatus Omnitrophota bacterium]
MDYNETLKYLEHLEIIGIKLGLENIKKLLLLSGNPAKPMRFVHIAGTNGKGSTARFIAEILKRSGYKVGLYTSPHLERLEERFLVNGNCISRERLAGLATYYRELIKKEKDFSPTYFEVTTAIALKYFLDERADICIMEVGLGGRLDATNVINPEVCVITSISQDHMQYLGHRLSDIAGEKFSIIKPGVCVVTSIRERLLIKKLKDICQRSKNPLMVVGEDIEYKLHKADLHGQIFSLNKTQPPFKIKLLGTHQLINASLAYGAVKMLSQRGFNITLEHIREGLEETTWPGRFEVLAGRQSHPFRGSPSIVLDGAHNVAAIKRLKETLGSFFPAKKILLVLGIMADKDWSHIIRAIAPVAREVVTCQIQSKRACPSKDIAREAKRFNSNVTDGGSVEDAISMARDRAGKEDVICVTGSLYVVGEARKFLK